MMKSNSDRELALYIPASLTPPPKNSASLPPDEVPSSRNFVASAVGSQNATYNESFNRSQVDKSYNYRPRSHHYSQTVTNDYSKGDNSKQISEYNAEIRSDDRKTVVNPTKRSSRRIAKSRKICDKSPTRIAPHTNGNILHVSVNNSDDCTLCDEILTKHTISDKCQHHEIGASFNDRHCNNIESETSSTLIGERKKNLRRKIKSQQRVYVSDSEEYGSVKDDYFQSRRRTAKDLQAFDEKMAQIRSLRRALSSQDDREDTYLINAGSCVNLSPHRYSLVGGAGEVLSPAFIPDGMPPTFLASPPMAGEIKDLSTDNSFAFRSTKYNRISLPVSPNYSDNILAAAQIITINVAGLRFQTFETTLSRYPNSLLGNPQKRKRYFNAQYNEYFLDRHRTTFESILHIYQTCGQVIRPESVPISLFLKELSFYEMGEEVLENFWISEGYQKPAVDELPINRIQRWLWQLMEHPDSSLLARVLAFISVAVIIISIVSFCAETLPELRRESDLNGREWSSPFFYVEFCCCIWFSTELFLRFVSSPSKSQFMKSFLNMLDFIAVAPFFINLLWLNISSNALSAGLTTTLSSVDFGGNSTSASSAAAAAAATSSSLSFSVLRIIRLVRVFRIFKLSRHSVGLQVLGKTFRASIQEFCLLIFFMGIALILFSSGVYFAEQNELNTKFTSIPASFWFVLATMTTVGYGDLVPQGVYGKLVGSMCALIGVLTLALPVPIIVANFKHFYRQECRLAQIYRQQQQLIHNSNAVLITMEKTPVDSKNSNNYDGESKHTKQAV